MVTTPKCMLCAQDPAGQLWYPSERELVGLRSNLQCERKESSDQWGVFFPLTRKIISSTPLTLSCLLRILVINLKDKPSDYSKRGVFSSIFYYNCHFQVCLCIKMTWGIFQNADSLNLTSGTNSEFLVIRVINISKNRQTYTV